MMDLFRDASIPGQSFQCRHLYIVVVAVVERAAVAVVERAAGESVSSTVAVANKLAVERVVAVAEPTDVAAYLAALAVVGENHVVAVGPTARGPNQYRHDGIAHHEVDDGQRVLVGCG